MKNRALLGIGFLVGYYVFFIPLLFLGLDSVNYFDVRVYISIFGVIETIIVISLYKKKKIYYIFTYILNCILSSIFLMSFIYLRDNISFDFNLFRNLPPFLFSITFPIFNTLGGWIFVYLTNKIANKS